MVEQTSLSELQDRLGHRFTQPLFLERALTHRSFSADHNERLEFLGDGLLNLVAAEMLFEHFPQANEGQLSRMRSHLVRQACLAQIGSDLQLSALLRLGEGERRSGGAMRASMLADAVEALLGAVYQDAGFAAAARVVHHLLTPILAQATETALGKDAKTRLQEWLQARHFNLPTYRVLQEGGTARSPEFILECVIHEPVCRTRGTGTSRRIAEQQAAEAALAQLDTGSIPDGDTA